MTKYTYSVADDTANGVVDLNALTAETHASAIITSLNHIDLLGDVLDIWFNADLSQSDETILDGVVSAHDGEALPENQASLIEIKDVDLTSNAEKALKVAPTKLEGSSSILVSHNFCDKTTWWNDSVEVETETLSDNGDHLTYNSAHTHWVDLEHGKVPYEDRIVDTYKPVIYINDVAQTSGFSINYAAGTVTFESSQEGNTIKADYHYATNSTWVIKPDSGKILKIIGTCVRFTDNVAIGNGFVKFQLYIAGNPYGDPTYYKNMDDFMKCAMGRIIRVEKFGAMSNDVINIDFDYITSKDLKSSQYAEIRISLTDHTPITGTYGVVVANVISKSE